MIGQRENFPIPAGPQIGGLNKELAGENDEDPFGNRSALNPLSILPQPGNGGRLRPILPSAVETKQRTHTDLHPPLFRRTVFPHATRKDWNDWRWQIQNRIRTLEQLEKILKLSAKERLALEMHPNLPIGITPYFMSLITPEEADHPLRRTVIPTVDEFLKMPGESDDPLAEEEHSPLPEAMDGARYRKALTPALQRIAAFGPDFLVLALGLDTAKADPTGSWNLTAADFERNGRMIGELGLPVVVIQEGGYRSRTLRVNARNFFSGLAVSGLTTSDSSPYARERLHGIKYRRQVQRQNPERIRRLVEITGYFSADEIKVAVELVNEHLQKGAASSGYHFIFAERYGHLAGYTCYGPVPATASSYDLYWIAVHPDFRRRGLGKMLLATTEQIIRRSGGTRIYVDTSMRIQYASTRSFYEHCGYKLESMLENFYAPGEAKAIYCKSI